MTEDKRRIVNEQAREFIDHVIAINQRHGMSGSVPDDVYRGAVDDVARATGALIGSVGE